MQRRLVNINFINKLCPQGFGSFLPKKCNDNESSEGNKILIYICEMSSS